MYIHIYTHKTPFCDISSLKDDLAEAWSKLVSLRSMINIFKRQIDETVLEEVQNRRYPHGKHTAYVTQVVVYNFDLN